MQLKVSESRLPFAPLLLIAPFFLWGTAMVAMKGVMPHTTPLFIAGLRLIPAGLMILMVAAFMGKPQPQGWSAWLWIVLFALVDGSLFQGFLAAGLVRTGAGLGSVMIDSQPIAVALLCCWLFQEQIGVWGWLGNLGNYRDCFNWFARRRFNPCSIPSSISSGIKPPGYTQSRRMVNAVGGAVNGCRNSDDSLCDPPC